MRGQADHNFRSWATQRRCFPPTTFTQRYVSGFVYIIGGLGYHGTRRFGTTPIYRLDCETWKIAAVASSGDSPGWIYEHKARLDNSGHLVVAGGKVCLEANGEEDHVANLDEFTFDLSSGAWVKS